MRGMNEWTPGPGSYESDSNMNHTKLFKNGKFGKSNRNPKKSSMSPGPGAYKIPCKIVEAPKYLLPNADDSFSYV